MLERRQRERWSVLAQYALFDFVRAARLVWGGLLELAGLVPEGELGDGHSRPAPSNKPFCDGTHATNDSDGTLAN